MRSRKKLILDTLTFPIRCLLFETDRFGLSSLRTDRMDYAARFVEGYTLDVGCGPGDVFVRKFLGGKGVGVDVFAYEGLKKSQVFERLVKLPFGPDRFETVSFVASLNHVPQWERLAELKEAYRCLRPGGRLVVTLGNPMAEVAVHWAERIFSRLFPGRADMDTVRGMKAGETYYITDEEALALLKKAGFAQIRKHFFVTQWGLNHLFVAIKPKRVKSSSV